MSLGSTWRDVLRRCPCRPDWMRRPGKLLFAAILALAACLAAGGLWASDEPNLTEEQIKQFLLNAKVINSRQSKVGITNPWWLTLTDGKITHDALFKTIDEHKTQQQFSTGRTEMNFRDSYHFDIAGYELGKLLGLNDAIPVYVERKWGGKTGSLCWGIPLKWHESDRLKQKLQPPDPDAWNKQMYRLRVFTELIYDTDPNLTNFLITEDWKLWRIDFTRAFRLFDDLPNPKNLTKCDRQLLEKLKQLNEAEVERVTKPHLTRAEVKAVMARRDKIVAQFQKLIAEKGESEVLY